MSETMKNTLGFSSGRIINSADFSVQKRFASSSVSKHKICSSSAFRNVFNRDMAVDMTDAMLCSEEFSAAPACHFAR